MELAAIAAGQPSVRKRAATMRPSAIRRERRVRSPQAGFSTSATASGDSMSPRLRGCWKWSTTVALYSGTGEDSEDSQLHLGVVGHHVLVPGRIEGELDVHLPDPLHVLLEDVVDLLLDARPDGAEGGGQGNHHLDVLLVLDVDLVDQAEVDDVDPQLGVVHLLEGLSDVVFGQGQLGLGRLAHQSVSGGALALGQAEGLVEGLPGQEGALDPDGVLPDP